MPHRLHAAETLLAGARPDDALLAEAGRLASEEIDPPDDLHASADYRRAVTAVVVERALAQALAGPGTLSDAREREVRGTSHS